MAEHAVSHDQSLGTAVRVLQRLRQTRRLAVGAVLEAIEVMTPLNRHIVGRCLERLVELVNVLGIDGIHPRGASVVA